MSIRYGPLDNMVHDWKSLFTGRLRETETNYSHLWLERSECEWLCISVCVCTPLDHWGNDVSMQAAWLQTNLQFLRRRRPLWGLLFELSVSSCFHLDELSSRGETLYEPAPHKSIYTPWAFFFTIFHISTINFDEYSYSFCDRYQGENI